MVRNSTIDFKANQDPITRSSSNKKRRCNRIVDFSGKSGIAESSHNQRLPPLKRRKLDRTRNIIKSVPAHQAKRTYAPRAPSIESFAIKKTSRSPSLSDIDDDDEENHDFCTDVCSGEVFDFSFDADLGNLSEKTVATIQSSCDRDVITLINDQVVEYQLNTDKNVKIINSSYNKKYLTELVTTTNWAAHRLSADHIIYVR